MLTSLPITYKNALINNLLYLTLKVKTKRYLYQGVRVVNNIINTKLITLKENFFRESNIKDEEISQNLYSRF